ncbi:MAG: ComF family protein, partial [Caulobacterales bacterium]
RSATQRMNLTRLTASGAHRFKLSALASFAAVKPFIKAGWQGARALGERTLDLIWPAHSLLSRNYVAHAGHIEPELWSSLVFLTEPCCAICGFPFEADQGPDALCLACEARKPDFDRARAALAYDDVSRKLVLDLKHGGRRDGLPTFAAWLSVAAPFAATADLILPTPLHYTRLIRRGHNQAAWLAQSLAKRVGRAWRPDVLIRSRKTPSQGGLSAAGRARNVHGAFRVKADYKGLILGNNVLLVDDVFTTGATIEACARALKRAGAARVDVVCLTRVVRPKATPI